MLGIHTDALLNYFARCGDTSAGVEHALGSHVALHRMNEYEARKKHCITKEDVT